METLTPIKSPKLTKKMESVSATECANCGTTTTPLWRRGPNGETICNACGLYLKARNTLRPPTLKKTSKKEKNDCGGGTCPGGGQCNGTGGSTSCAGCPAFNQHQVNRQALICANCRTTTTPLWRRDEAGNTICNACGLYYKLHHVHRPVSMKRSVIKRRKRIIIAQGSDGEEEEIEDDESIVSENDMKRSRTRMTPEVPEIEDYVVKKKAVVSNTSRINLVEDKQRQEMNSPTISFEERSSSQESISNSESSSMVRSPSLLPPISSERQSYKLQSLFIRDPSNNNSNNNNNNNNNLLPSLSLPPLTSPPLQHHHHQRISLSPPSVHQALFSSGNPAPQPMKQREYELADFDMALDKLEHLRRQVRPEQACALSQLTHALTDLATKAEVILSLDSLAYSQ